MAHRRHTGPALLALAGLLLPGTTWARQNIAIGEISIGYDYQERKYAQGELADPLTSETADTAAATDVENGETTESGTVGDTAASTTESTASTSSTESTQPPTPTLTAPREGDTRSLFITPRIRVSSTGATDLVEFTYGPTFTWDEVDNSDNVGHDLNLNAEKNLSPRWLVRATDSFYYGTDTVADYQRRSGDIVPTGEQGQTGADATAQPEPASGTEDEPAEPIGQELTEDYGRREYWRNDFGLHTDYTYAQDSVVGAGYNFGLLRNVEDDSYGYDDYDRHEGIGRLSYRFNRRWHADSQVSYVNGIYDEAALPVVVTTPAEATAGEGTTTTADTGNGTTGQTNGETTDTTTAEGTATAAATQETVELEDLNEDLQEYRGRLRLNYDWSDKNLYFGEYSYSATNYESEQSEDAAIHRFTAGWEHAFTNTLRMTLSGGPTFISYDKSDNETGYNAFAGLNWKFARSSLSASTAYDYEFENFDGRSSGLSKTWYSQLAYNYQITPSLQAGLSGGYERSDRDEPRDVRRLAAIEAAVAPATEGDVTAPPPETDNFQYTDETWDAGVKLSYTFQRRYTVAVSYRYADFQSDYDLDYDEHRVLLTLTASSEIFRW